MRSPCFGPRVNATCGALECPRGSEPPDTVAWEEWCERCQVADFDSYHDRQMDEELTNTVRERL